MYHPRLVDARLNRMLDHYRQTVDLTLEAPELDLPELAEWENRLNAIRKEDGELTRNLLPEEEKFILGQIIRCKADARYFITRFARIRTKTQELRTLQPTYVQDIFLRKIAERELAIVQQKLRDGILFDVLKARQLGISTVSEALIAHRVFFYANTSALIAGDTDFSRANIFAMLERYYDNTPWWLRPRLDTQAGDYKVKNEQIYFKELDNIVIAEKGRNTRGGDTLGLARGQIARGGTFPLVHLTELSTWDNPDQIDEGLMPSIPADPRSFVVFESTARGRGNWWHNEWISAKAGESRLSPIFSPWYVDPNTYIRPAPADWTPSEVALAHSKKVYETSLQWTGRNIRLTRDQLYWWDWMRTSFSKKHKLHIFVSEYASDDLEAFANTGASVFPATILHELYQRVGHQPTVIDIMPKVEIDSARRP